MPMAGNGPMPKIISGSSTMFATHPHIRLTMLACIRPTDWKIFSKVMPSEMMSEKAKAMLE